MNRFKPFAAILPALAMLASCSQETDLAPTLSDRNCIIATVTEPAATRTFIDGNPDEANAAIGVAWSADDQLGVFSSTSDTQTLYSKKPGSANDNRAVFASETGEKKPVYAYYPHDNGNHGKNPTNLTGRVHAEQTVDVETNYINDDYKVGRAVGGDATNGYTFVFKHLFSLARVNVNADGTDMAGDKLQSVVLTVANRSLAGEFTFNAVNANYTSPTNASSSITAKWESQPTLSNGAVNGYISLIPTIKSGDKLQFTITTDKHVATLEVTSKVDFVGESLYNFPLQLSNYVGKDGFTITPIEEPAITGTFTCATYNVDGLPNISGINKDGPGKDGTKLIGDRVNISNWDFFGVSEDFEHHQTLAEALTNFNAGTYRGTVTSAQIGSRADTDGLEFFWKKDGVTVSKETFVQFKNEYGGLTGGANTCIKKGFRYYLVTFPDGTEIDVYITHMNTYSSGNFIESASKWLNAANGQLTEIAEYVKSHQNGRPVVIMGDTNCRYNRHKIKELLFDALNDGNMEVHDPWIDLVWGNDFSSVGGGAFPAYGGKSLMTSDATGTNSSTDVIISEADGGLQKGEVVDKIFYINNKNNNTQLKANTYLRDISFKDGNGKALADHYPVVVEFTYTTKK